MKKAIFFILALLLLSSVSAIKVAYFGDSITKAGVTSNGGYAKLVSKSLNYSYVNFGINGLKIEQLYSNLDSNLSGKMFDYAFVMIGTNNVGMNVSLYESYLSKIVDKLRSKNIKVILLTIPPRKYGGHNTINTAIRHVSSVKSVKLVDTNRAFNNTWSLTTFYDWLHPNDYGHFLMTDKIVSERVRWH